jgi:CBS domain containing-hemolysin-like protein
MTATDGWSLALAGLLVVAAALAAAADAALSRVSRVAAQELVKEHRRGAARLLALATDPARALNTALFVRVVCEVTATVLVARVALDLVDPPGLALLVAAGVMVAVAFVVVGVAPRTLGRQHATQVALAAAGPVAALATVLGPLTRLLILVGNAITPGRGFREGPFASEAELRELVDLAERERVIEDDERQMIHSVFELGDTLAREVMVPRTDLVVVGRDVSLRRAISLSLRSGFSRIPVVGENIDDIVGIVYLKDLARRVSDVRQAETTERVEQVMRAATFVPDSKPVDVLLREMQAQRIHAAIVIDEYGGTAGLVTIEDILEEIVGEISDEYDTDAPEVEELPDGTSRVSARMNVWDFVERFGLGIDEDDLEDIDTVGGLLQASLGRVPIAGSVARIGGLELVAESLAGRRNRIGSVLVRPVRDPAAAPEVASSPPASDDGSRG